MGLETPVEEVADGTEEEKAEGLLVRGGLELVARVVACQGPGQKPRISGPEWSRSHTLCC